MGRIHFMRAGEGVGSPIVLVHGWPGAVLEFERLIPLLVEAGHEVIAPSLPGYGFSDAPESRSTAAASPRGFASSSRTGSASSATPSRAAIGGR